MAVSGFAQVTVRRNRDGSYVIINEVEGRDPVYDIYPRHEQYRVAIDAKAFATHVVYPAGESDGG